MSDVCRTIKPCVEVKQSVDINCRCRHEKLLQNGLVSTHSVKRTCLFLLKQLSFCTVLYIILATRLISQTTPTRESLNVSHCIRSHMMYAILRNELPFVADKSLLRTVRSTVLFNALVQAASKLAKRINWEVIQLQPTMSIARV